MKFSRSPPEIMRLYELTFAVLKDYTEKFVVFYLVRERLNVLDDIAVLVAYELFYLIHLRLSLVIVSILLDNELLVGRDLFD